MEPEELAALQAKLGLKHTELALAGQSAQGIGLLNIHNRLRHLFGEGYGLTVDSRLGYGTTVNVKIPKLPGS